MAKKSAKPSETTAIDLSKSPRYLNDVRYEVGVFDEAGILCGFIHDEVFMYALPRSAGHKTIDAARRDVASEPADRQRRQGNRVAIVRLTITAERAQ